MRIKNISPILFLIAIFCFLLPWIKISCDGQKMATYNGAQLVIGTTIEEPSWFDSPEKRKIPGETLAIFVFLSVCIGLILSFIKSKKGTIGVVMMGSIGIIFLLLLKSKLNRDIVRQSMGLLQINYMIGYYLILFVFIVAIFMNFYSIVLEGKDISLLRAKNELDYKFCTECGTKNKSDNEFCKECGTKLSS